jgi:membrane associated rhomboid family serine protease
MTQVYLNVNSTIPMVGASGAISGVLGAYMVRYPKNKVLVLIPLGFFTQLVKIPAMFVLGFWFILQFISSSGSSGQGGVAYGAHIGGFVFGAAVMFFFGNFLIPKKAFFKALNEKDGKKKNPWIQD